MKAMILAAGRGERLRPYTDTVPKPLLTVADKPLSFWHLEKLAQVGIQQVVINTAWLGEQLVAQVGDGSRFGMEVLWSHEPAGGLETAGGIVNALPLLGSEPFLVVNGDVFTHYSFAQIAALEPNVLGHLVLVDNPAHHPQGDFTLTESGRVAAKQQQESGLTFSGISLLSPALFSDLAPGKRPLREIFVSAIEKEQLTGEYFAGYWNDVGTPERLAQVNRDWVCEK